MFQKGMPYIIHHTEQENEQVHASFSLDEKHPVFSGHFPGQPVLPGVLQMRLVADILSHCLQQEVRLEEALFVKFLAPVVPGIYDRFDIQVTYSPDGSGIKADARIEAGETVFMKMKSRFRLD